MSAPQQRATHTIRLLSRRAWEELGTLQAKVRELGACRNAALRIFIASRYGATAMSQRDFWLEFSWADQEYRAAVHRLAQFCAHHRDREGAAAAP